MYIKSTKLWHTHLVYFNSHESISGANQYSSDVDKGPCSNDLGNNDMSRMVPMELEPETFRLHATFISCRLYKRLYFAIQIRNPYVLIQITSSVKEVIISNLQNISVHISWFKKKTVFEVYNNIYLFIQLFKCCKKHRKE